MADQLVVLRTYSTVTEADLAKSALQSIGIDSTIRNKNKGGQIVDLLVRAEDVTAANDMLGIEGLDSSKKR